MNHSLLEVPALIRNESDFILHGEKEPPVFLKAAIGDNVYFMRDNKICCKHVILIKVDITYSSDINYKYYVNDQKEPLQPGQFELSKAEILARL